MLFTHPSLAGPRLRESGRNATLWDWRQAGGAWAGRRGRRALTPKRDRLTVSEQAMHPPLSFRVDAQRLLRTCCSVGAKRLLRTGKGRGTWRANESVPQQCDATLRGYHRDRPTLYTGDHARVIRRPLSSMSRSHAPTPTRFAKSCPPIPVGISTDGSFLCGSSVKRHVAIRSIVYNYVRSSGRFCGTPFFPRMCFLSRKAALLGPLQITAKLPCPLRRRFAEPGQEDEDDGWDDEQEAEYQDRKQVAYEVRTT